MYDKYIFFLIDSESLVAAADLKYGIVKWICYEINILNIILAIVIDQLVFLVKSEVKYGFLSAWWTRKVLN